MESFNSTDSTTKNLEDDKNYYKVPSNLYEFIPTVSDGRRVLNVNEPNLLQYRKYRPSENDTKYFCSGCDFKHGIKNYAYFLDGSLFAPHLHSCEFISTSKKDTVIKNIKTEANDGNNVSTSGVITLSDPFLSPRNSTIYQRPPSRIIDIIFLDDDEINPDYEEPPTTNDKPESEFRSVGPELYQRAYSAKGKKETRLIVFEDAEKNLIRQYAGNQYNSWFCMGCYKKSRKCSRAFFKDQMFYVPKMHFCDPFSYEEAKKEQDKIIKKQKINENELVVDINGDEKNDSSIRYRLRSRSRTRTPDAGESSVHEENSIRSRLRSRTPTGPKYYESSSETEIPVERYTSRVGALGSKKIRRRKPNQKKVTSATSVAATDNADIPRPLRRRARTPIDSFDAFCSQTPVLILSGEKDSSSSSTQNTCRTSRNQNPKKFAASGPSRTRRHTPAYCDSSSAVAADAPESTRTIPRLIPQTSPSPSVYSHPQIRRRNTPDVSVSQIGVKRKIGRSRKNVDSGANKKAKPAEINHDSGASIEEYEEGDNSLFYNGRNSLNVDQNESQKFDNPSIPESSNVSTPVISSSSKQRIFYSSKIPPASNLASSHRTSTPTISDMINLCKKMLSRKTLPSNLPPTVIPSTPVLSTPSTTPIPPLLSDHTTTVKWPMPSVYILKKCCEKLDLVYTREVYNIWMQIEIDKISPTSVPDNIFTTNEEIYFGWKCISLFFTGREDKAGYIWKKVNKHVYCENSKSINPIDRESEKKVLFSESITEAHLKSISQWFECRIGIFADNKWTRYGNWSTVNSDILTLLMEKKDEKYFLVLSLK